MQAAQQVQAAQAAQAAQASAHAGAPLWGAQTVEINDQLVGSPESVRSLLKVRSMSKANRPVDEQSDLFSFWSDVPMNLDVPMNPDVPIPVTVGKT